MTIVYLHSIGLEKVGDFSYESRPGCFDLDRGKVTPNFLAMACTSLLLTF